MPQAGQLVRGFPERRTARHPPELRSTRYLWDVTHNFGLHFTQELGNRFSLPTLAGPRARNR